MIYKKLSIDEIALFEILERIHFDCFAICKEVLDMHLPVAGNIGLFSQSNEEYERFLTVRNELCESSDNPNQKYFRLKTSLSYRHSKDLPTTKYDYLYIRKFDSTSYGRYLGDVDFVLPKIDYLLLKKKVQKEEVAGAKIYDRPNWDTIEMTRKNYQAVAYVSTQAFVEKVRIKFD